MTRKPAKPRSSGRRPREGLRLGAECEKIRGSRRSPVPPRPRPPQYEPAPGRTCRGETASPGTAGPERACGPDDKLSRYAARNRWIEQRLGPWRLRHIRGRSAFFCFGRQEVEIERHRIAQPHAGKRCCRKPRFAPQASDKRTDRAKAAARRVSVMDMGWIVGVSSEVVGSPVRLLPIRYPLNHCPSVHRPVRGRLAEAAPPGLAWGHRDPGSR